MKKLALFSSIPILLVTATFAWAESININQADVATLDQLDGIGAKKAESIVSYRKEHGDFKRLEDLKEVPGIGEKLFDRLKDKVVLGTEVAEAAKDTTQANQDKASESTDKNVKESAAVETKPDAKVEEKAATSDKSEKVSDKASSTVDKS